MKNIQSTTEGVWVEKIQIVLTENEKTILKSKDVQDAEAQQLLRLSILSQTSDPAQESDSVIAQAKYDEIKPIIEYGEEYQLIAMDCVLEGTDVTGILNYRINGEHKQVRF